MSSMTGELLMAADKEYIMKLFAILTALIFTLSLLSGCMSAVVVTSPRDEEFKAWDEATDKTQRDLADGIAGGMEFAIEAWAAEWAKNWEDRGEDISERFSSIDTKKHRWKVLDANGKEISTVTDKEKVKELDDVLCRDDIWESLEESSGDPAYTYVYSQEKTLLAGQDPDAERECEDLLAFTVSASEDVVTLRILGGLGELSLLPGVELEDVLTFPVSVPADTAEALRNPMSLG